MSREHCPDSEVLSAYVDGETTAEERLRVSEHLPGCAWCRDALRVLGRLKGELRQQPVPSMPKDLEASLERLVPAARPVPSGPQYPAFAFCLATALLLLFFWTRRPPGKPEVPLEALLAAHNQYARTLPLAETETLLCALPEEYAADDEASLDGD